MNTNLPTNYAFTDMDPPAGGGMIVSQVRCPFCGCSWCGGASGCGCGRWVMPVMNMPAGQQPSGMVPPINTNLGTCDCTVDQKSLNKAEVTNMCLDGSVPVCVEANKCECKFTTQ